MKRSVSFCVATTPIPQARPRFSRRGHAYDTKRCREYKKEIAAAAREAMGEQPLFENAVGVRIYFQLPIPQSWSKKDKEAARLGVIKPTKRGDIDNLCKPICDGANGVVWVDDGQVCRLTAIKRYGDSPCVIVDVWEV